MTGKDKIAIEVKGKMIEIPIHLTGIETKGDWTKKGPPSVVLRMLVTTKEELREWLKVAETVFK